MRLSNFEKSRLNRLHFVEARACDVVHANFEYVNSVSNSCANNEVAIGFRAYSDNVRVRSIELRCADISAINQ